MKVNHLDSGVSGRKNRATTVAPSFENEKQRKNKEMSKEKLSSSL
jgi:hypothetical protein